VKKLIAPLIILAAVNSCIAMDKNEPIITYVGTIKIPSKKAINLELQKVGLGCFKNTSITDIADTTLHPVTVVGHVNGVLKEQGFENDSIVQPKLVKILISNAHIYRELERNKWINPGGSNVYT
jgi:hypothetical protein